MTGSLARAKWDRSRSSWVGRSDGPTHGSRTGRPCLGRVARNGRRVRTTAQQVDLDQVDLTVEDLILLVQVLFGAGLPGVLLDGLRTSSEVTSQTF